MKLLNRTDVPAAMNVGSTGDVEMLCIIASKVTYRASGTGLGRLTGDEAWPVFEERHTCEGVVLPADLEFRKRGIDLVVVGRAVAPGGRAVPAMYVGVECGRLHHRLAVYGDRWWWNAGGGELIATEPQPYTEMPLSNDRAFGGSALWDDIPVPHAVNPAGRGFYLSAEQAENQPLPNLEDPEALIRHWSDQPEPAVLYKPQGVSVTGLQAERLPDDPDERAVAMAARMMATSFNASIPALVARSTADLGPQIQLLGFTTDGSLTLPMPPRVGPVACAEVGALRARVRSRLSTLVVLPEQRAIVATYLCLFRYLFRPHEARSVELRWDDAPALQVATSGAGTLAGTAQGVRGE